MEVALDEVVRDFPDLSLVGMVFFLWPLSFQSHLMHEPLDLFMVHCESVGSQGFVHSPNPVSSAVSVIDRLNLFFYLCVSSCKIRDPLYLKVVCGSRHPNGFQQIF